MDQKKALLNKRKHGISFEEAVTVFYDTRAVTFFDEEHSGKEDRFRTIKLSEKLRVLLVVTTETTDTIRMISARKATKQEIEVYHHDD